MTINARSPRARPRWALLTLLVAVALFGSSIAVVLAQLPGSSFAAADGNLSVQGSEKDWNSFTDATVAAAANFAQQGDAGYEYAGGIKHDTACPKLAGTATTENVHNKSDFTRMYIAYEEIGGETFLYLAWQRVPQNSDTSSAHASFIFAQEDEELCDNGVTPVRTEGDLLVTYDFAGGSTGQATIGLSTWVTSGPASQCETSKSLPCWGKVTTFPAESPDGQGSVNHRTQNTAECVASKNPLGAVYDAIQDLCLGTVEFGEAAINLTTTGVFDTSEDCISFGSVHVGSRASGNSFDAQLKDLIVPLPIELTNCAGIEITKTDDAGTPLAGVTFTLHENVVVGGENTVGAATTFSCTTDADGVCTIDDIFTGVYWVVETNLPAGHDPDEDLPYSLVIDESNVNTTIELSFVNPRQRGSILIEKTDGTDRIGGATFAIDADGDPDTTDDQTAIPPVAGETGLFCIDGLLAGDYVVIETQAPTGYDGAAPQTVSAVVPSTCAERLDEEDEVDATFVNVLQPGDIEITKTDDAGNTLAGVTFQLYADTNDAKGAAIDGKSCTTDSAGECTISGVAPGTYWIDETNLGANYAASSDLPKQVTVTGGGTAEQVSFTNPRLHRIIVLVCHQGTDTLHSSDVTIGEGADAVTKQSLAAGTLTEAQQNALCGLGGATFDGFDHEEVDVLVDIGSH